MKKFILSIIGILIFFPMYAMKYFDFEAYNSQGKKLQYNITSDVEGAYEVEVTHREPAFESLWIEGNVIVPETVEYNNKTYTVTGIGDNAFMYCHINGITLPNTIKYIGIWAFHQTYIKSIDIPEGVEDLSDYAFNQCSLTNISLPSSIKRVGIYCFGYCSNLSSVSLNEGLEIIDVAAFQRCTKLTSITIPSSVKSIGNGTFDECANLSDVFITDLESWCNIDFGDMRATPMYKASNLYLNNELLTELIVPNSITHIKDFSFSGCNSITKIFLHKDISSIGTYGLSTSRNLTELYCEASTPPTCGSWAFYQPSYWHSCTLFVPEASVELYSQADQWKDFTICPMASIDAIISDASFEPKYIDLCGRPVEFSNDYRFVKSTNHKNVFVVF